MKPAPFQYLRPESLDEALALLGEHGEEAKVLAGGQSFVPLLNTRLLRPDVVIDLNRIPGLDGIETENGAVRVGALVRQRALEESSLTPLALPLVAEALPHVGHFVTRNRGTVGGAIAHADPAAELPLCLAVLGGAVVARSAERSRELAADAFFLSHFTTALAPGELVVETVWPALGRSWGFAFEEFSQRHGDFGLSIAAAALRVEDGRVTEARVGIGSVVERPTLLETGLAGNAVDEQLARETGARAASELMAFGNLHASPEYERHLTGVLVERAVLRAWRNALEGPA